MRFRNVLSTTRTLRRTHDTRDAVNFLVFHVTAVAHANDGIFANSAGIQPLSIYNETASTLTNYVGTLRSINIYDVVNNRPEF